MRRNEISPRTSRFERRSCTLNVVGLHFCHMSHTITIRLNKELAEWLEATAAKTGISQGQLVRNQLEKAKGGGSGKPYMSLAGSLRGLPKDLSARKGFSTK